MTLTLRRAAEFASAGPIRGAEAGRRLSLVPADRPSVVASAAPMAIDDTASLMLRRTRVTWEEMAWRFFRSIPIAWYANVFKANAISRLRIFPAIQEDPDEDPVRLEGDKAALQLAVIRDLSTGYTGASVGHRAVLGSLTLHYEVPGQCYWWGHVDPETGRNVHEILSIDELMPGPGGFRVRRYPGLMPEPIPKDSLLVRLWQGDPQYKTLPTSPMQAQLDVLEEMYLLMMAGIAGVKSRIKSDGILLVPDELDYKGTINDKGEMTEFEDEFLNVGRTAMKDPRSPARWFPFIVRGKSEYLKPDVFRWLQLFKDAPKEDNDRLAALENRFATGMNLPGEVIKGFGDMTHWNAWIVDSMTWPHLEPIAQMIFSDLSASLYRPLLMAGVPELGIPGMSEAEAQVQTIWFDESLVVAKPDRSAAADIGLKYGAIHDAAWRRAHGFEDDDAPTDQQRAMQFGWQWGDPGLASHGNWDEATGRITTRQTETEKGVPGESPVETAAEGAEAGPPGPPGGPGRSSPAPTPPSPAPPTAPPAAGGPPGPGPRTAGAAPRPLAVTAAGGRTADAATGPSRRRAKLRRLGPRLGRIDRTLLTDLSRLAHERLIATVTRAGAKLRSNVQAKKIVASAYAGVDNLHLPQAFGPSRSRSFGLDDRGIVESAAAAFGADGIAKIKAAQEAALAAVADATDQEEADLLDATASDRSGWLRLAEAALVSGFAAKAQDFLFNPAIVAQPNAEIRGEVSDIVAPRSAIRQALSIAGGGSDDPENVKLGLAGGPMVQDALSSGDAAVQSWVWSYNDVARTTFPGHLALDTIEFSAWDDDQLAVQPEDDWLGIDYYFPGDHNGCGCSADLTVGDSSGAEESGNQEG